MRLAVVASNTPNSAMAKAKICKGVMVSLKKSTPIVAAEIGRKTVNTPAWWA